MGFCGETEEDHLGSERFLEEQNFLVNYIFKYDPRPTTKSAEAMSDDISTAVKKERNQRMLELSARIGLRRMSSYVGQVVEAFLEETSERFPGSLSGRTVHGLPINTKADDSHIGGLVRIRVNEATAYGMSGELLTDEAVAS